MIGKERERKLVGIFGADTEENAGPTLDALPQDEEGRWGNRMGDLVGIAIKELRMREQKIEELELRRRNTDVGDFGTCGESRSTAEEDKS